MGVVAPGEKKKMSVVDFLYEWECSKEKLGC